MTGLSDRKSTELKLERKDVETPFEFHHRIDHVLKDVANCRETRLGEASEQEYHRAMRKYYANDAGKLAAWISASHVEKAPKKTPPPTP